MPCKEHLEIRCENAYARRSLITRKNESRLRQIELQRERLHDIVIKSSRIFEDAERIAREAITFDGEDIEEAIEVLHDVCR